MEQEGNNQVSIATLLRLAADGELTAEQEARLRAHLDAHPEDQARVDFDRKLRDACGCACAPECCAPESLRQRVLACCNETPAPSEAAGPMARAEQTRDRGFWAGRVIARFGAVAAVIALVGVVAFMVGRGTPPSTTAGPTVRTAADQIASFVRKEHTRCTKSAPDIGSKFTITEPDELPAAFQSIAGQEVSLASVLDARSEGLRFIDAGLCYPPAGNALHIRFETDDENASRVSLWIQKDDESLPIEDGVTYTKGEGCDCVRFWRVDGVRYVLICSDAEAAPIASVAFHSPTTVRPF